MGSRQKLLAEFLGSLLLVSAVVGSGIMGETLSQGNLAIALLANSVATGAALYVLILIFGPVSGAHFNPAVSLFFHFKGSINFGQTASFIAVQFLGAAAGTILAHAMFDQSLIQISSHVRSSPGLWLAESIATCGLILTIWFVSRFRSEAIPHAVAAYIVGAYWWTASTSFANPAVTVARGLTTSFAGIAPQSIPAFVAAQIGGVILALVIIRAFDTPQASDTPA